MEGYMEGDVMLEWNQKCQLTPELTLQSPTYGQYMARAYDFLSFRCHGSVIVA